MTDEQIAQSKVKLIHIPTVMGAVVPIYNLPGVNQALKFAPDVLADIYLGKITNWNDARIAKDNPGATVAEPGDFCCAPLRRQRHHVHLHRLSLEGQQRLEEWPGQGCAR